MIVSTVTITTVDFENNTAEIRCFANKNDDGTTFPEINNAKILPKKGEINKVSGKTGELFLTTNLENKNFLDEDGRLNIETIEDDANYYSLNKENLEYNGQ